MLSKEKALQRWFHEVWAQENSGAIFELFQPDGGKEQKVAYGFKKDEAISPEEFAAFHAALLNLIGDIQVSIDFVVETEDWITAECTLAAKSRASGLEKEVGMKGVVIVKFEEGIIKEAKNYFDFK